jgi:hypothetical protein
LRAAVGTALPPSEIARYERGLATTRAGLSPAAFDVAWEAGQGLAWMQAAEEALAVARRIAGSVSATGSVQDMPAGDDITGTA